LREVARKKIFSYVKMGIITIFPDNSKRYISISGNKIEIEKIFGGHMVSISPPMQYKVSTTFTMYSLQDDGMIDTAIGTSSVYFFKTDITGIDLYSSLYEEIKRTLHNHTDDDILRVSTIHNHEEEE